MERKILYKYRSLDGIEKDRTTNIFLKNELWFSNPKDFNDPFDCRVELSLKGTEKERKEYVKKTIKECASDLKPVDRLKASRRLLHKLENNDSFSCDDLIEDICILSLSAVKDDILMWSHYANSHRGICIGFYADNENNFFGAAREVEYGSYPNARIYDESIDIMKALLLTKSDHWDYEKEYRVILHSEKRGLKSFKENLMASVILGCEISSDDKNIIINLARKHAAKPKIYCATKSFRSFSLDIKEIT